MKPTVPETGRVIKLDNGSAVIMLEGGKSCKGCGAAKIGLCRAGNSSMLLTARNTAQAKLGDQVVIGIDQKTQRLAYLLAYLIPLFNFMGGALTGNFVGELLGIQALDVLTAFFFLCLSAMLSFRELRKLDKAHQMEIRKIISDGKFTAFMTTEEERLYLNYSNQC